MKKEDLEFQELLEIHLNLIHEKLDFSINELKKRKQEHDQDKTKNPQIQKVYQKHFAELKKLEFGTKEYFAYEKKYFQQAHYLHAQNRHHFYSQYNQLNDINLFDLLEAIIDISQSAKQYGDFENYQRSLQQKEIYNYDLKELINNTITYLNKGG